MKDLTPIPHLHQRPPLLKNWFDTGDYTGITDWLAIAMAAELEGFSKIDSPKSGDVTGWDGNYNLNRVNCLKFCILVMEIIQSLRGE